ncbi:hypothetical protein, partial [Colwellia echini]|uniref:hypothetical protein n=1 Tax=Colwellia echini TaxID=1982103 RepID=UPI001B861004
GVGTDSFTVNSGVSIGTIDGGNGANTYAINGTAGAITGGVDADTFTIGTAGITGALVGGAGDDIFTINGDTTGRIASISGGDGDDTVSLDNTGVVTGTIAGGAQGVALDAKDTFNLTATDGSLLITDISGFELIDGVGNAILTGDSANTWLVNANNAGTLNGINFTDFVNLVGGSGTDGFTVNSGVTIGSIGGGNGVNTYAINGTAGAIT